MAARPVRLVLKGTALGLLILAVAAAAWGQRPGRGPGRGLDPESRLERLTQRLDLSEAQQQKIEPLLVAESAEIRAIFEEAGIDPDVRPEPGSRPGAGLSDEQRSEMRTRVEAVHQETATAIEAELDEEQAALYREYRQKAREKRRGRRAGGRGGSAGTSQP